MAIQRERRTNVRLLIVEEDRMQIDELRDIFVSKGFECEVALSMETAWRILGERKMGIVVVDVAMKGLKDREIIAELKAKYPDMKLVAFNGTKKKTEQRKLRRLGADSYLSKASDLVAVGKAVERILEAG